MGTRSILYRFRVDEDIKCDDIVFKYDDSQQAKVDRDAFYHLKNKTMITTGRVHITQRTNVCSTFFT